MRWMMTLVAMVALTGCGGAEQKPPAGSEGSATSLDIQVESSDASEASTQTHAPATGTPAGDDSTSAAPEPEAKQP